MEMEVGGRFNSGFLNGGTADICGWTVPSGCSPVHCGMLSSSSCSTRKMTIALFPLLCVTPKTASRLSQMLPKWREGKEGIVPDWEPLS